MRKLKPITLNTGEVVEVIENWGYQNWEVGYVKHVRLKDGTTAAAVGFGGKRGWRLWTVADRLGAGVRSRLVGQQG